MQAVVELLRRRLGAANLFDYGAAVSYYELDLAIPEERHVMITLLKCSVDGLWNQMGRSGTQKVC